MHIYWLLETTGNRTRTISDLQAENKKDSSTLLSNTVTSVILEVFEETFDDSGLHVMRSIRNRRPHKSSDIDRVVHVDDDDDGSDTLNIDNVGNADTNQCETDDRIVSILLVPKWVQPVNYR